MNVLEQVLHREDGRNGAKPRLRPLRFVTFLAPNLFAFYQFVTRYLGDRLGLPTELRVGTSYEELTAQADVAFVCGLPYVELTRQGRSPVEPLVAPVLQGERYGGKPIYYSDVIVRRDSPFRSFADLRGRSWAYNEPHSQSGYGITRYHLARLGETNGYFGRVVEAGWHEQSLRMVCSGEVDASAIDSHVLAVALRDRPELARQVRVIEVLGPSSIQPVVAARHLPEPLKAALRGALLEMGGDPAARPHLARALVERFTPVTDATYDDIRTMLTVVEAAGFLNLR
ncbi:MAG TPA: PhnD/SsuA/transferrin family substrate-binding protein [Gemmataceae bacterium]|nr:PhnD/SsuA/transferrin family substrate-binding protein [Gemmataceae bacterium]